MLFAEIAEIAVTILILLVLGTQILVPLLRGTPFFPVFRRERKLAEELTRAEEEVRNAEMEERIGATRRRADHIHRSGSDADSGQGAAPGERQAPETEGNDRSQSL